MSFDLDDLTAEVADPRDVPHPHVDWRPELSEAPGRFWRFSGHAWWQEGKKTPDLYISLEMWKWYRTTPRGCWVVDEYWRQPDPGDTSYWAKSQVKGAEACKKLILTNNRKKWAYPTKEEAWNSFRIRTDRRVQYARNALATAEGLQELIAQVDELRADKQ